MLTLKNKIIIYEVLIRYIVVSKNGGVVGVLVLAVVSVSTVLGVVVVSALVSGSTGRGVVDLRFCLQRLRWPYAVD